MPSVSKSERRFFGAALGYKRGETSNVGTAVKQAAKSMSVQQLRDYASTKEKGLPEHKK